MPYVVRMSNYLKRVKAPLPDGVSDQFPDYRSVSAVLRYWHAKDERGNTLPYLESTITLVLIPKSCDGLQIKDVCTLPGPQFPEWQHQILVSEARSLLKNPQRLEQILKEHSSPTVPTGNI